MRFFFTTYESGKWSTGPNISSLNPHTGYDEIATLAEAQEVAEHAMRQAFDEGRSVTVTFGVLFDVYEEVPRELAHLSIMG